MLAVSDKLSESFFCREILVEILREDGDIPFVVKDFPNGVMKDFTFLRTLSSDLTYSPEGFTTTVKTNKFGPLISGVCLLYKYPNLLKGNLYNNIMEERGKIFKDYESDDRVINSFYSAFSLYMAEKSPGFLCKDTYYGVADCTYFNLPREKYLIKEAMAFCKIISWRQSSIPVYSDHYNNLLELFKNKDGYL